MLSIRVKSISPVPFEAQVENCGAQHPLKAPGGKSPGDISLCLRCGNPFTPEPTRLKTIPMTRHCQRCHTRNVLDGLGLPTPPELLDRFSRNPALSKAEYYRKLDSPLEPYPTIEP